MTILWKTGTPPPGTPCDNQFCTLPAEIIYQEGPIEASLCIIHATLVEADVKFDDSMILTSKER